METSGIVEVDRAIGQLEKQLIALHRKRVALLEQEISDSRSKMGELNGSVAQSPPPSKKRATRKARRATKKKAAATKPAPKAPAKKKRKRTSSKVVEKRILKALKEAGNEGLSQKQVSDKSGIGYQTVAKKLKELPGIQKKGSGRDGRYSLKA